MDDAEFFRLRDRVSALEVQGRERWRVFIAGERRLRMLEARVDDMTEAEKITAAVGLAVRAERRAFLNVPRKIAGAVLALLIAVPAAHELVGWLST